MTSKESNKAVQRANADSPLTFYRLPDLVADIKFSKSTIYTWITDGKFPQPIKLGRSSVWDSRAIEAWKRNKVEKGGDA